MVNDYNNDWNATNRLWVSIINAPVYKKLLYVTEHLECFAAQTPDVGAVEVVFKPELHLGRLHLIVPALENMPADLLCAISDEADECEAYEISGGKQRLCVTFHRLFTVI